MELTDNELASVAILEMAEDTAKRARLIELELLATMGDADEGILPDGRIVRVKYCRAHMGSVGRLILPARIGVENKSDSAIDTIPDTG